jgi:hypothetical protein
MRRIYVKTYGTVVPLSIYFMCHAQSQITKLLLRSSDDVANVTLTEGRLTAVKVYQWMQSLKHFRVMETNESYPIICFQGLVFLLLLLCTLITLCVNLRIL